MAKKGKNTSMSDGVRAGIRAYQMKKSNEALQKLLAGPPPKRDEAAYQAQRAGERDMSPYAAPPTPDLPLASDMEMPGGGMDSAPTNFGAEGGGEMSDLMRFSLGGSRTFTKQEVRQGYRRLR